MGHTQCVSQTPEADTETPWAAGERAVTTTTSLRLPLKPTGDSVKANRMIVPSLLPEKSLIPVRLKDSVSEQQRGETTEELTRVENAMSHLHESGWYWGSLTAAQAKQVLNDALEGTFLLRDSSNPGYLLTLSVKTSLGPTHLRIEHSGGAFGFDSLVLTRPRLRQFSGVVDLVQHYALSCQQGTRSGSEPKSETKSSTHPSPPETTLQLILTRPLYKAPPSLQHLCRIVINQRSPNGTDLPLPRRLKDYLQEYPFLL